MKFPSTCAALLLPLSLSLPLGAADPVKLVEENRRLELEIRELETRWTDQANANKKLERENRNLERVIAQQQQVLAETRNQPKGAAVYGSSVVKRGPAEERTGENAPAASASGPVYQQDFKPPFQVNGSSAKFASVQTLEDGRPALVVVYPASDGKTNPCLLLWLKTDDVAGAKVRFSAQIKAENISKPPAGHLGGKFGLMVSRNDGKTEWPAATIGGGSFDWKQVSFTADIPYGVRSVAIMLGLQGVTGRILFRDLKVEYAE